MNVAVSDDGDKDIETPNPVEWLLTVIPIFQQKLCIQLPTCSIEIPLNEAFRADSLVASCGNLCNGVAVNAEQDDDTATKHRA